MRIEYCASVSGFKVAEVFEFRKMATNVWFHGLFKHL